MPESIAATRSRDIYAGMLICIAMMVAMLWMPAVLGALALGYGLETGALARLASAELIGFLLGSAFTSNRSIAQLRPWVVLGCVTLIAVNLALIQFAPGLPFLAMRPIAGFAAGIGFGYGLKLCAMSIRPTRYFGIITGLMSLVMIIGFQGIARLMALQTSTVDNLEPLSVQGVVRTIFSVYALLAAFALCVYLAGPGRSGGAGAQPAPGASVKSGALEPLVVIGLFAIVVSFAGQGGTWAFLQTLGISHGFSVSGVANAMSAFALLGIAGSFAATGLPNGLARWVAIGAALLLLFAGLYALHRPQSVIWYMVGCGIGGFYWNFILPLILGLLASVDQTGRASVLGGTMSSAGSALGPMLAGPLIHGSDYQLVGWMTGIFCLLGCVCVWIVERRSGQR